MIKNVIFDMGGVMVSYDPRNYIRTMGYEERKVQEVYDVIYWDCLWQELDLGNYTDITEVVDHAVARHPNMRQRSEHFLMDAGCRYMSCRKRQRNFTIRSASSIPSIFYPILPEKDLPIWKNSMSLWQSPVEESFRQRCIV